MTPQTLGISGSSHDIAAWVLTTVQNALVDCDREPINRAYIAAGQIAWDDCCGMLVVAPERIFKSARFPEQNASEELCWGGYIAVELLVLLVRCVPVVDDRGRPPSAAALQTAYQELIEDAAVVYNACLTSLPYEEWERALPVQTFVGAEGGCIAVETRLTLGIPQDTWGVCCAETTPHIPGDAICRILADRVTFEPCDDLTSTTVQDAICELAEKVSTPGVYGAFVSSVDQLLAVNTAGAMTLNVTTESSGVSVVGGSQITFAQDATFDLQFSAQIHHRSGGGSGETIRIWLAHNGIPVPQSATRVHCTSNRYLVAAWDWLHTVQAGDHVEIMWQVDNDRIVLERDAAAGGVPEIPSLIVTVIGVG